MRQIAGCSSDKQCNYAEPPAKAKREGPAWPAWLNAPPVTHTQALTLPDPLAPSPNFQARWGKAGRGEVGRGQRRRDWGWWAAAGFPVFWGIHPRSEDGGIREKASFSPG